MELMVVNYVGVMSLSVFGKWDVKFLVNLDDNDLSFEMGMLFVECVGFMSMLNCLWKYFIFYMYCELRWVSDSS